jgi:2-polyprenyl-3-methyl-5-hydroxy-6-metoxy-1,4-benzoquinol methylase
MRAEIKLWDKVAKDFHKSSFYSRAHKIKYLEIADEIIKSGAQSVLDLGCGSGILEKILIKQGFKGTIDALDASENMLEIARQNVKSKNVSFTKKDLDQEIELHKKYDFIVAINVLFFLLEKKNFLESVRNHLKDRGSLFILIAAKPIEESNMFEFIRENFRGLNLSQKIFHFLKETQHIKSYFKMALNQIKIDRLEREGKIVLDSPSVIRKLAKTVGLEIISVNEAHAKQNWIIVMRKV